VDITDKAEREARRERKYVVEIKLPDREFRKITEKALRITEWDRKTGKIHFESPNGKTSIRVSYERDDSGWKEIAEGSEDNIDETQIEVTLEEDMNTPPRIYVSGSKMHERALLLDLNPQFSELTFGRVQEIIWRATDGHQMRGGLYLPPEYRRGKRYPLVIQTHGFDPHKFWIDGPWSSAFAAQPLAGRDIAVLQVGGSEDPGEDTQFSHTPKEAPREMAAFEGAIDYLDSIGIIDRNRVGIVGFSRTVYTVKFALSHSQYRFAAATLADGIGGGYFEYVAYPSVAADYDLTIGAAPFDGDLTVWLKNSPGFNMAKVHTPVRIEAYGTTSVLSGWEWYVGLVHLEKPADFIYIPGAPHVLVKPKDRVTSQEGTVNWFSFWLKGEEKDAMRYPQQYNRWRQLLNLRDDEESKAGVPKSNH
jgi:dipeptidyl aminopeptidase/acylaminoacyl peptidase